MGIATATKPKLGKPVRKQRAWFREDVSRSAMPLSVDRDAGVIRGVKICGLTSRNGRQYPLAVLREALKLYDGCPCNMDHPAKAAESRGAADRIGRFVRPVLRDDGIYADLEYLKSHPMAERLCEAAERMPGVLGFSHNAEGDSELRDGGYVVTHIYEVRSVDLVADPATTKGLFEGRTVTTMTLRKLLESVTFSPARQKWATRLLEMDDMPAMDAEVPMDDGPVDATEPEPVDHEQALKDGFRAAILAILDDESLDAAAKIKKIGEYLKTHEKLVSPDEPAEPKADADTEVLMDEEYGDKEDDKDETMESLRRDLKAAKDDLALRDLCESIGVKPNPVQRKALLALDGDDRKQLAESFKQLPINRTPRSAPLPAPKHGEPVASKTPESFLSRIKN